MPLSDLLLIVLGIQCLICTVCELHGIYLRREISAIVQRASRSSLGLREELEGGRLQSEGLLERRLHARFYSLSRSAFQSTYATFELLSTLRKLCTVVWTDRLGQVEDLHLNLLLKMVALANFNAKMNSLKEVEHNRTTCQ